MHNILFRLHSTAVLAQGTMMMPTLYSIESTICTHIPSLIAYSHLFHPIGTSASKNLLAAKTTFHMILFRKKNSLFCNILTVSKVRYVSYHIPLLIYLICKTNYTLYNHSIKRVHCCIKCLFLITCLIILIAGAAQ